MNRGVGRLPFLDPLRVRDFRFQWSGDLATSWAAEMETIILGWYVLVETGSVLLLTVFASLQYVGTLVAPAFGVAGDRIGHRDLLCAMRALYAVLAAALAAAVLAGAVSPPLVLAIAALAGLVRPSDLAMRNALIGGIIPPAQIMGAMSLSRTTSDSARVAGALAGTGLVGTLGMGGAYVAIVALYAASAGLTACVSERGRAGGAAAGTAVSTGAATSPWRDILDSAAYVRRTPALLGAMALAFLVNLTSLPFFLGLLPYAARDVHGLDQAWLGYFAASFSVGALAGSLALGAHGQLPAARTMIAAGVAWYGTIVAFGHAGSPLAAVPILATAGVLQSLCMIPMSVVLLRVASPGFRGRVMALRILAIYGLPLGLILAGPLIAAFGFAATATLYGGAGAALTAAIGVAWRRDLWRSDAAANAR